MSTRPSIDLNDEGVMAEYASILTAMREILGRRRYAQEVQFLDHCLALLVGRSVEFGEAVSGRGIWGGSGSVSDCELRGLGGAPLEELEADQRCLDELHSRLARRLIQDGMVNPRVESLGKVYGRWAKGDTTE